MSIRVLIVFMALLPALPGAAQTSNLPTTGVRGYVYVEPFEIRKEFVLPLRHLVETLGLSADGQLDASARETLLASLGKTLSNSCPILADGAPLEFELDRIQFVVIDPVNGVSPETREVVPVSSATVAAVFVLTREAPPTRLEITWDFFPDGELEVPVGLEASTGTSMEFFNRTLKFTPSKKMQSWEVPDIGAVPTLLAVAAPPRRSVAPLVASIIVIVAAGVFLFRAKRSRLRSMGILLVIIAATWVGRSAFTNQRTALTDDDARALVDVLLQNIYHAFAYRDESRIFDTLAASVSGDLLEDLYLDIRRGLELEETGGPRIKIHRVRLEECTPDMSASPGFRAAASWSASGNVSHWGHIHPRRNKYRGDLRIEPVAGRWRVTDVQILEEERE